MVTWMVSLKDWEIEMDLVKDLVKLTWKVTATVKMKAKNWEMVKETVKLICLGLDLDLPTELAMVKGLELHLGLEILMGLG